MITTVTVIGSGTMGNGIAHCFAQHGFRVRLIDSSEDALAAAVTRIRTNLERQQIKGAVSEAGKENALHNISTFTDLEKAVEGSGLVIECVTEDPGVKEDIFKKLSAACDRNTILATNTSSISISRLASVTDRPEQVIGMHFMNPVPLMKLVEVIRGYSTSNTVTSTIMELSVKLDKVPVEVNDYPGFVANRLLMPMINEAIYALYEGVAGVTEIDTVMKLGLSHPMGPLQLADFIGLDVCLSIMRVLHDGFGDPKYFPCPLLANMVTAGDKGVKTGRGFYQYSKENKDTTVSAKFRRP